MCDKQLTALMHNIGPHGLPGASTLRRSGTARSNIGVNVIFPSGWGPAEQVCIAVGQFHH